MLVLSKGKVINYGNIHNAIHQLNFLTARLPNEQLIHQQTSLSLPIITPDNGQGLMVLSLKEQEILLPSAQSPTHNNKNLRCFILASDISICLSEPQNSSIVNHLSGKISAIESSTIDETTHSVLVTVVCSTQAFFVHISTYSQLKLALSINQPVYLQFKAGAVRTYLY